MFTHHRVSVVCSCLDGIRHTDVPIHVFQLPVRDVASPLFCSSFTTQIIQKIPVGVKKQEHEVAEYTSFEEDFQWFTSDFCPDV